MFKIADGREHFYQWDLDRQIIVDDPSIKEVHFCNRTDDCSLVVDVYLADKLYANVPNIILTNSFDVRVFGYDGKATLHEKTFKVKPRTKPADYVYVETEARKFDELMAKAEEAVTYANEICEYVESNKLVFVDDGEGNVELKAIAPEGGETEDVDLSNYYTKEETEARIEEAVENIEIPEVDLSAYATEEQIYKDMNPYSYEVGHMPNINIGRASYLPLGMLSAMKHKMKYIKENFTLTSPLIWDVQTELNLCIETDNETFERTIKLPEPAVMWNVDWLEGRVYFEWAYKVLDKSKLHLGEDGTVYTTLEEQGWEPHLLGSLGICNRLSNNQAFKSDKFAIDDDGKLTITISASASAEENLATINSLDDFIFVYRKDWEYCTWEQLGEPLDTTVTESDDHWVYAYMPGMDEENIYWSCYYYKPVTAAINELEVRLDEIGDVDLTDYATKEYVDSLFEGIATAEGGAY